MSAIAHFKPLPPKAQAVLRSPAAEKLQQLAKSIHAIETAKWTKVNSAISTGSPVLDAALPGGGYHPGSVVEWVSHAPGDGGLTLALLAAKAAMGEHKHAVIVDPQQQFYPPAAKALGVAVERLIVLHPSNTADAMWSFDQSLRCPALAAVIAWQDKINDINARRLQLAAEQGCTLGLLLRRADRIVGQPTWTELTWQVRPISNFNETSGCRVAPPGIPSYSDNYRWMNLRLSRMRAGRGKSNFAGEIADGTADFWVAIEGHRGTLHAQKARSTTLAPTAGELSHGSTSAVHLAAQLALPARGKPTATRPRTSRAG